MLEVGATLASLASHLGSSQRCGRSTGRQGLIPASSRCYSMCTLFGTLRGVPLRDPKSVHIGNGTATRNGIYAEYRSESVPLRLPHPCGPAGSHGGVHAARRRLSSSRTHTTKSQNPSRHAHPAKTNPRHMPPARIRLRTAQSPAASAVAIMHPQKSGSQILKSKLTSKSANRLSLGSASDPSGGKGSKSLHERV